jgi:transglutaminase-like putative cysteine protease
MKLRIVHRTVYRYRVAPRRLVQTLRLTPRHEAGQQVLDWAVSGSASAGSQRDAWGNHCHTWTLERPTRQMVIQAGGVVDTSATPWWQDAATLDPGLYLRASPLAVPDAAISALAQQALPGPQALGSAPPDLDRSVDALLALAAQVRRVLPYRAGQTHAGSTAAQALALGAGVCQDHAHVFIAACRSVGVPARYVSGYWLAQDSSPSSSPRVESQASHAWAEVCVDMARRLWLAVDVTHGDLAGDHHVRLALGPDYSACAPVRGVRLGGAGETLQVWLDIAPA